MDQGLFANLHAYVQINPALAPIAERLQLKRLVPMAVDQAIVEIITPVVERSVTIACMTAQELIVKVCFLLPSAHVPAVPGSYHHQHDHVGMDGRPTVLTVPEDGQLQVSHGSTFYTYTCCICCNQDYFPASCELIDCNAGSLPSDHVLRHYPSAGLYLLSHNAYRSTWACDHSVTTMVRNTVAGHAGLCC